jgi:hypothetical protein
VCSWIDANRCIDAVRFANLVLNASAPISLLLGLTAGVGAGGVAHIQFFAPLLVAQACALGFQVAGAPTVRPSAAMRSCGNYARTRIDNSMHILCPFHTRHTRIPSRAWCMEHHTAGTWSTTRQHCARGRLCGLVITRAVLCTNDLIT